MSMIRWVIRPYLYIQYLAAKLFSLSGFQKNRVIYLMSPYQNTGNFIKDGLFRHHVKQFHESSCSVASVVCVINVLLEKQGTPPPSPITQQTLLETVNAAHWKERMSEDGYKGRRGLPLPVLGKVVEASLNTYGIRTRSVETVQVSARPELSSAMKHTLRSRLLQFEKKGNCLIMAHFNQGSVLPELHIPHISPVGGYDPATGKVTFLDVDPDQPYPYQVSFDTFYGSIASNYNPVFRHIGYAEGGYIFIEV